jgi:26S proteasome regulatory subunit N12
VVRSEREVLILGLNLLSLLASHKLAAFHTELELIPTSSHNNMYIKHAIDLELCLMEGSYNKLRAAREKVPGNEYLVFMDILMETVREEIAECTEKAYWRLKLSEATKLLFLKNDEETRHFGMSRKWKLEDGIFKFEKKSTVTATFEETSKDLIAKTLNYAKEMERII